MKSASTYRSVFLVFGFIASVLSSPLASVAQAMPADSSKAAWLEAKADLNQFTNPDSSFIYYSNAADIYLSLGDSSKYASMQRSIGYYFYMKGDYVNSMDRFQLAAQIFASVKDEDGLMRAYNNLGLIHMANDDMERAFDYYGRSLERAELAQDTAMLASLFINMGIAHKDRGNLDSALVLLQSARDYSQILGRRNLMLTALNILGEVQTKSGNFDEALQSYQQVISNSSPDEKWERGFARAGIAEIYVETREAEEAIRFGNLAYRDAEALQANWELMRISGILSKAYEQENDYINALKYQRLFSAYSDSVLNEEKDSKITRMELAIKESEAERLGLENKLQQRYIWFQRIVVILVSFGMLVALYFLYTIHRKNRTISTLNENLRQQKAEIQSKNAELKQLNQTKDRILSTLAHDLGNLFGSVIGYFRMYGEGELQDDEMNEAAPLILANLEAIQLTMSNLLRWASDQFSGVKTQQSVFTIAQTLNELEPLFRASASNKQIQLNFEVDPDLKVQFDQEHLSLVLRNLIHNAIKYTQPGGKVNIKAEPISEEHVCIRVEDSGKGLNAAKIKAIRSNTLGFNSEKGTQGEAGTGFGLQLVQSILHSHLVELEINSGLNKGTSFSFSIKRAR